MPLRCLVPTILHGSAAQFPHNTWGRQDSHYLKESHSSSGGKRGRRAHDRFDGGARHGSNAKSWPTWFPAGSSQLVNNRRRSLLPGWLMHLERKASIVDPDFGVVGQRFQPRCDLAFRHHSSHAPFTRPPLPGLGELPEQSPACIWRALSFPCAGGFSPGAPTPPRSRTSPTPASTRPAPAWSPHTLPPPLPWSSWSA